jgi:hypothetical protein
MSDYVPNNEVAFSLRDDPRRSFRIDLDTMTLVTECGTVYKGVYLWKGHPLKYHLMNDDEVKSIDFTKISFPALDDPCFRIVCPVDGLDTCVYFKPVE